MVERNRGARVRPLTESEIGARYGVRARLEQTRQYQRLTLPSLPLSELSRIRPASIRSAPPVRTCQSIAMLIEPADGSIPPRTSRCLHL